MPGSHDVQVDTGAPAGCWYVVRLHAVEALEHEAYDDPVSTLDHARDPAHVQAVVLDVQHLQVAHDRSNRCVSGDLDEKSGPIRSGIEALMTREPLQELQGKRVVEEQAVRPLGL